MRRVLVFCLLLCLPEVSGALVARQTPIAGLSDPELKGLELRGIGPALATDTPPGAEGRGQSGGRGEGPPGQPFSGGGGRGPQQGPLVSPDRYHAQLGRQAGVDVTAPGAPQSFAVVPLER
jgi:hypothetical protein